ncbi:MAG: TolC family protein [Candidatus Omnitrophota bacterium]
MKRIISFLIMSIFMLIPAAQGEDIYLAVDEAVAIALRDNSDILLKAEDVKKQRSNIDEAKASLYPALDFTTNWMRSRSYYEKDFSYNTYQFGLKQTLYSGGEIGNNIKYNEYTLEADKAILDKTKLDTASGVKKAFYTLLFARRYAGLNKAMLNNAVEHLDSTRFRYKNGHASESDMLAIRSSLDSVREGYESSLNDIAATEALLNNYLRLDKDVKVIPRGEFIYKKEDAAYDAMLERALKDRPEMRQYANQELAAERSVDIAAADNKPTVSASWDYYSRSHGALGTAKNRSDYNMIGITVSWPVFDGWLTKSKIEQANIDLKTVRITRDRAARDITLELKNAYLSWKDAIMKINAARSAMEVYRDNLVSLKKKFKDGIVSSLDVQDGILKYSISRFNNTQAVYDYLMAKNDLDKAMGDI